MWLKHKFEEGFIYSAKIGRARFWIQKYFAFWRIALDQEEKAEWAADEFNRVKKLPDGIDWSHLIADKQSTLIVQPALPDKAVVIRPVKIITMLPDMKLDLMIRIPLWVQLYSAAVKPENMLFEFPSIELNPTWFGEPDDGELAYRIGERVVLNLKDEKIGKYEALCPVRIINESPVVLHFQRLSIHADELNIYGNDTHLCTNEIRVIHKEEGAGSDVQIVSGNPSLIPGMRQVASARNKPNRNLFHKSFHLIKSFTQY
jgi:hypothetical protein